MFLFLSHFTDKLTLINLIQLKQQKMLYVVFLIQV